MRYGDLRPPQDFQSIMREFLKLCMRTLDIDSLPSLHVVDETENGSFGWFDPSVPSITFCVRDRHPADVLRTLAHELVHWRQYCHNSLDHNSGDTGSTEENEAHAIAGVIMREWNQRGYDITDKFQSV